MTSMIRAGFLTAARRTNTPLEFRNDRLSVEQLSDRKMHYKKLFGPDIPVLSGETLNVERISALPRSQGSCAENTKQPHGKNTANLHIHGFRGSPTTDSTGSINSVTGFTDITPERQCAPCIEVRVVDVKTSYQHGRGWFRFEMYASLPTGIFWFRAHKHGSATGQVADALAGALVVQDGSGFKLCCIENVPNRTPFITNDGVFISDEAWGATETYEVAMRPIEVQFWWMISRTGNGTDFALLRLGVVNLDMVYRSAEDWMLGNNTQVVPVCFCYVCPTFLTFINGEPLPEDSPHIASEDTIDFTLSGRFELKTRFETYAERFLDLRDDLPNKVAFKMQLVEGLA